MSERRSKTEQHALRGGDAEAAGGGGQLRVRARREGDRARPAGAVAQERGGVSSVRTPRR